MSYHLATNLSLISCWLHTIHPWLFAGAGHTLSKCLVSLPRGLGVPNQQVAMHLVIKGRGGPAYVAIPQLKANICRPLGVCRHKFRQHLAPLMRTKRMRVYQAPADVVRSLRQVGALSGRAAKCDVVSMATAAHLLSTMGLPKAVVDSFAARHPAASLQQQPTAAAAAGDGDGDGDGDGGGPSSAASQHQQQQQQQDASTPFPATLTPFAGGDEVGLTRYGLTSVTPKRHKQQLLKALALQLDAMRPWQQAVFQVSRPVALTRLSDNSWLTLVQRVHEFLGYLWHCQAVHQPTLQHYLDACAFAAFVGFLQARGLDKPQQLKATHTAIRVVSWLVGQESAPRGVDRCQKVLAWLDNLHTQMRCNLLPKPRPDRDPHTLQQQGKWMEAPMLLLRVMGLRAQALAALAGLLSSSPQQQQQQQQHQQVAIQELEVAGMVHDALFACMCFGYLPPLRSSILLTLTFLSGGRSGDGQQQQQLCIHPDCQKHLQASGCKGNRVFKDTASGRWRLEVVHHKNSPRWGGSSAIRVWLPPELFDLLDYHTSRGYSLLMRGMERGDAQQPAAPKSLFISLANARPLLPQEVSQLFTAVVLEGSGCKFGPQVCRSIYVAGSRDMQAGAAPAAAAAAAAGSSHQASTGPGAAMVMGNSLQVWDRVYDRHFDQRQAEEALASFPAWREAMQAAAAAAVESSAAPPPHQQLPAPPTQPPHAAHHQQQQQHQQLEQQLQQQQPHHCPQQVDVLATLGRLVHGHMLKRRQLQDSSCRPR